MKKRADTDSYTEDIRGRKEPKLESSNEENILNEKSASSETHEKEEETMDVMDESDDEVLFSSETSESQTDDYPSDYETSEDDDKNIEDEVKNIKDKVETSNEEWSNCDEKFGCIKTEFADTGRFLDKLHSPDEGTTPPSDYVEVGRTKKIKKEHRKAEKEREAAEAKMLTEVDAQKKQQMNAKK